MSQLFANKYRTQSTRLPEWDYSSWWWYFCTICVDKKECLLWEIIDWKINLSEIWKIVEQCRLNIPNHFPNAESDEYVIMPNHFHGILYLHEKNNQIVETTIYGVSNKSLHAINRVSTKWWITWNKNPMLKKNSLWYIIRRFKWKTSFQTNKLSHSFHRQSWFYEHVIRNNQDLQRIQEYIQNNTYKRQNDEYYNDK